MASIRKSINGALKLLGVVGGHGDGASDQELADCLDVLHGMYHSFVTNGSVGRMRDVIPHGDYVIGENQRVVRRRNEEQKIVLPDLVSACGSVGYCLDDLLRLNANVTALPTTDYGTLPTRMRLLGRYRTVRDLSVAVINDEISGTTDECIYDASLKKWFVISNLDQEIDLSSSNGKRFFDDIMSSEAPMSHRDYNGFISWLAIQLEPYYENGPVKAITARNADRFEAAIAHRYGESDDCWINPAEAVAVATIDYGFSYGPDPIVVPDEPEVVYLNNTGNTLIASGTTSNTLKFIVAGDAPGVRLFEVNSVAGLFTFTAANAALVGNATRNFVILETVSNQVVEEGFIRTTGATV